MPGTGRTAGAGNGEGTRAVADVADGPGRAPLTCNIKYWSWRRGGAAANGPGVDCVRPFAGQRDGRQWAWILRQARRWMRSGLGGAWVACTDGPLLGDRMVGKE